MSAHRLRLKAALYTLQIGLPIYITETGICDHTSLKRPAFFTSYFDEVRTRALTSEILTELKLVAVAVSCNIDIKSRAGPCFGATEHNN